MADDMQNLETIKGFLKEYKTQYRRGRSTLQ